MLDNSNNKSIKVRNYAIAVACVIFAICSIFFLLQIFFFWKVNPGPITTWSECQGDRANIYISTLKDTRAVKCVAHNKELFINNEITLGDLLNGDEDVCEFKLSSSTTEPLKFEIWYNGKVRKEVCGWGSSSGFFD